MAELTHVDEKLAEVLGLAQAARAAINKVATLARQEGDAELLELLQRMEDEAAKVEQGCDVASSSRDGVRTAIAKKALPLQQAHVDAVREQSLRLAGKEDPTKPA
jgi:gamma-glutamyl phosphate reductase